MFGFEKELGKYVLLFISLGYINEGRAEFNI